MPRRPKPSTDNILRFLQLKTEPATIEDISRSLYFKKNQQHVLQQMLARLKKRGLVDELSPNRYLLKRRSQNAAMTPTTSQPSTTEAFPQHKAVARDEIRGRLVHHQDGYGFVVPEIALPSVDGDIF